MPLNLIPYNDIEKVEIHFKDEEWVSPNEKEIIKMWRRKKLEITGKNRGRQKTEQLVLYNGPLTRVSCMHYSNGLLACYTQRTDYAHYIATKTNHSITKRANPLFVGLLFRLIDNGGNAYYVFGISSGTEATPREELNLVAGAVHPDIDRPDGYPSPGVALQRELVEELGMTYEAFNGTIRPSFVVRENGNRTPSLVYEGMLRMDKEELIERHRARAERDLKEGKTPEFKGINFIRAQKEAVREAIELERFHKRVATALLHHLSI